MRSEHEYLNHNPLGFVAIVIVVAICREAYDLITTYEVSWMDLVVTVLLTAFLVCYFKKKKIAWTIGVVMFGVFAPMNAVTLYLGSSSRLPAPAVLCLMVALWLAALVYLFYVRARYYAYVDRRLRED